jgi:outer membrane protein assembly factor BamB
VYVPAWGASVSAVDLQTGQPAWIWRPGRSTTDTAANIFRSGAEGTRVSGDTVFVTAWHLRDRAGLASENWLIALDRATGQELWRVSVPSGTGGASVFGAPVIHANLVIFAGVGGHVWAIDRVSSQVVWQFTAAPKYSTITGAELHGDTVYFDGGDESLYAISAGNGALIWKANTASAATRDLLVSDTRVYYPTQGTLKIYDKATGAFIAEASVKTINDIFETPAAAARSRVFVVTTPAAVSFDEP